MELNDLVFVDCYALSNVPEYIFIDTRPKPNAVLNAAGRWRAGRSAA